MISLRMISPLFSEIHLYNQQEKQTLDMLDALYSDSAVVHYESEQPGGAGVLGKYYHDIEEYENKQKNNTLDNLSDLLFESLSQEDRKVFAFWVEGLKNQFDYFRDIPYSYSGRGSEYQFTSQQIVKLLLDNNLSIADVPLDKVSISYLFDICKKIDCATIISNYETETYVHGINLNEEIKNFSDLETINESSYFSHLYTFLNKKVEECTQEYSQ